MTSKYVQINSHQHVLYDGVSRSEDQVTDSVESFYHLLNKRRSIREFSDKEVSKDVIQHIIMTASSAPSGAHKQPWTFCAVSDQHIKDQIKEAAEAEERESYANRMSDSWLKDLEPFGTDANKPFLSIAPWLIVVFKRAFEYGSEGEKLNNYYVNESVGIACGMLIAAIHNAGLATLTHTPSPMNFLAKVLDRPKNERPYLLLPVGYPQDPTYVPDIQRKTADEVIQWY